VPATLAAQSRPARPTHLLEPPAPAD
jgi:hypothetical protein